MRRWCIALASSVLAAAGAAHAAPPERVVIDYEVRYNGSAMATAQHVLEHNGKTYRLVETWEGSGLLSLLGEIRRTSEGRVTPEGEVVGSIAIDEGRIAAIVPAGDGLPEARAVVDGGGAVALPGLIDTHTHARDPSNDAREDFGSATAAAAAGGITTILEMPISTPAVSSSILIR